MTARILVTLCTYNERDNLEPLLACLDEFCPEADVLVVDDNSPDGTGAVADEISAKDPRVHVLHREGKQGLGTAILAGFRYGIEQNYELLINLDADFSHHPRHIPEMLAAMQNADVAIGSRYVPGGGVVGWGFKRQFMSTGINWYARLLLGLQTKDNSGSFRCYRVSRLAELDLDRVRARGYAFQEEILYRLNRLGCRFTECPIVFEDRRHGESKINNGEAVAAFKVMLQLAGERIRRVPVTRDSAEDNGDESTESSAEKSA